MFEKVNIQDLKFNPFDEISNHWVLISAKKDGVVNTMTASWGQLGHLWGKNVMTVYIRPQRYTKEFVDAEDYFTVTLFDGYKKELGVLGSKSGRDGDKIAEVSFDIEEVENQPTFKQGKMVFVCKKIYSDMIDPKQFIDSSLDERWYPQKDYHQRYIGEIIAVYENDTKKEFTIGIRDDVTNLSLDIPESYSGLADENSYTCRFYGLGGDGTVSANKNAVKIIGKHTDRYVQAYFDYDSKKSGGLTVSHLRFSDRQIRSTCLVNKADFVSCQNQTYLAKYDMISDIKKGGTFLINCSHDDKWINNSIPFKQRMHILKNDIKVYAIDGLEIGRRTGLNSKISTILQCAFFKVTGIIPIEEAIK